MAVPKSRELLLSGCFMMAILLQGCGGKPLSEREIVRGIYFEKQGGRYSACLLLAEASEDAAQGGYTTVSATGDTAASALATAESSLQGSAYYGLADLAVFPALAGYAEVQQLGSLLYEKVQPAPELSLFLLPPGQSFDWSKDAAGLYEKMKACEKKWRIHCGLEQLFAQENCCVLPVYAPDGFALAVLQKGARNQRIPQGLPAGLAALLAGLGKEVSGTFAAGTATCKASAAVTSNGANLRLHLREAVLQDLSGTRSENALRRQLCNDLLSVFSVLAKQQPTPGCDPYSFAFRQKCLYGAEARYSLPRLQIVFE